MEFFISIRYHSALNKHTGSVTALKVVLRVINSTKVWVHNEDSLESKMEFKFVQRIGTAVISM